ncbi:hypothetical protein ACHAW5_002477 [Stephanodiscus triporus]|uniref:Ubiquitin-like protease family profile domain-containing protein n=1 Tax=Stephanodiscus triporus TaxID=2934178 RepID=A0ABD3QJU2_9STRA
MTELPPSTRGQNCDDFDDKKKKNVAEEGSKNDDGGGTGDDGNDSECGNGDDAYDVGDGLDNYNDVDGIADHDNIASKTGGNAKASGTGSSMSAANPPDMERKARDYAMKLMRPFTAEEQTVVEDALKDGPPKEILAKQGADSVQRGSMQTLCRGQWLNDEVINYFLKNCLMRRDEKMCTTDTSRRRSHFFNSFFIQTMFDEKSKDPELRGRYNFDNVKNWSKKVPGGDIFNLKYIVCPINIDDTHWTSAVIFMEDKRIQYYDSMGGTDWSKLEGLLKYVKDEYSAKNGKELDVTEWELLDPELERELEPEPEPGKKQWQ